MHADNIETVRTTILRAWPASCPPGTLVHHPNYLEAAEIADYLRGKSIDRIARSQWINNAMPFFDLTPLASCYCLGSYLLRVLDDFEKAQPGVPAADLAVVHVVDYLTDDRRWSELSLCLSTGQQSAILPVLQILILNKDLYQLSESDVRGLERRCEELRSALADPLRERSTDASRSGSGGEL